MLQKKRQQKNQKLLRKKSNTKNPDQKLGFFISKQMKNLLKLFLFALLLLPFRGIAQDTIYKRNGDILFGKILEVNLSEVKFKNWNNLEGPTYSLLRAELFMIRYKNGSKDLFLEEQKASTDDYATNRKSASNTKSNLNIADLPISIDGYRYSISYINLAPKRVDNLLIQRDNKQISLMIRSAQTDKRTSKLLSFAPIACGVGAYVTLIAGSIRSTYTYNGSIPSNYLALSGLFVAAGIGTTVSSFVLNARSKKMRKKAVELYNLTYFGEK